MAISDTTKSINDRIAEQEPYSSYKEVAGILFCEDGSKRSTDWDTYLRVMRTGDAYTERLLRLLKQLPNDALTKLAHDLHDRALPEQKAIMDRKCPEGLTTVWSDRGFPLSGPAAFAFFAFKKMPPGVTHSPQWADFVEAQYKDLEALVAFHQSA